MTATELIALLQKLPPDTKVTPMWLLDSTERYEQVAEVYTEVSVKVRRLVFNIEGRIVRKYGVIVCCAPGEQDAAEAAGGMLLEATLEQYRVEDGAAYQRVHLHGLEIPV